MQLVPAAISLFEFLAKFDKGGTIVFTVHGLLPIALNVDESRGQSSNSRQKIDVIEHTVHHLKTL